jgi:2-phosphosulfolactate phosphatase
VNGPVGVVSAHGQTEAVVRFEWGLTGALAIGPADVWVVIDALSFTTAWTVAAERGITVLPYRWADAGASEYAVAHDAVLAVGRREGRAQGQVSLSPASILAARGVERLVLPSPNGSTICFELALAGGLVVAASLRNASAVAHWLAPQVRGGATVGVVAAGERWPEGSLRPAVEDLWGAGAVLSALAESLGGAADGFSPEARVAQASYDAIAARLPGELALCASGRELLDAGFAEDVAIAGEVDVAGVVPLLREC